MKTRVTAFSMVAGLVVLAAARADDRKPPADGKEKNSYCLGLTIGSSLRQQEADLDYDWLTRGIKDAQVDGSALLTEQEFRDTLNKLAQERVEKLRQLAEKNKKDGEEFLAANKHKPGVIMLDSGLQYKVVTEGDGPTPKPEDTVTVNYRGTLLDGTEFESSAKSGKPASFQASQIILRGWTEALTRMKTGSKWQLFVPSELAYGPVGHLPQVGPNAALIFEVELLETHSPRPPAPSALVAPASQPLTSDIIKVPSLEEMQKGARIETIKAEDLEKGRKQQSNPPPEKK